jgi:hyperosmotically inducible periplasmic protein
VSAIEQTTGRGPATVDLIKDSSPLDLEEPMNKTLWTVVGLAAALSVSSAASVQAGTKDKWISTKATLALLTSDGFSVKHANVDTRDGNVVLHGTVGSEADKARAENTVRGVSGVKSIKNLLQVVSADQKEEVKFEDSVTKDRVKAELKADRTLHNVDVASVNNGVVLLKGKVHSLATKVRAAETAYGVPGVEHVSTEIEVEVPED